MPIMGKKETRLMNTTKNNFLFYAKKAKEIRINNCISVKNLSEKLKISRRTLWAWENNKQIPNYKNLIKLSEAINIDLSVITNIKFKQEKTLSTLNNSELNWTELAEKKEIQALDEFNHLINNVKSFYNEFSRIKLLSKALFSSLGIMYYVKDINNNYIFTSEAFMKSCSIDERCNIYGQKDNFFFSRTAAIKNQKEDESILVNGEPIVYEGYIPGTRNNKWGMIIKKPILKDNRIYGIIGCYTDITDRKYKEDVRILIEESLNEMNEAVWIVDTEKDLVIYINDAVETLYEYPREVFLKKSLSYWQEYCSNTVDSEEVKKLNCSKQNLIYRKFKIKTSSGKEKWLISKMTQLKHENKNLSIIKERDITFEKQLQQKYNFMLKYFDISEDCIWIGTRDDPTLNNYKYSKITKNSMKYFRYSQEKIIDNSNILNEIRNHNTISISKEKDLHGNQILSIKYKIKQSYETSLFLNEKIIKVSENTHIGVIRNITKEENNKFLFNLAEEFINNIEQPLMIFDLISKEFIYLNKACSDKFTVKLTSLYHSDYETFIKTYTEQDFISKELYYLNKKSWPKCRILKIKTVKNNIIYLKCFSKLKNIMGNSCIVNIFTDITKQKQLKDLSIFSQKQTEIFNCFINNSRNGIYIRNNEKYITCSPSYVDILGCKKEEINNNPRYLIENIISPCDKKRELNYFVKKNYPPIRKYTIKSSNGVEKQISEHIFHIQLKGKPYICGIVEKIQYTNNQTNDFFDIIASLPEAIFVYNIEKNIFSYANNHVEVLFNIKINEFLCFNYQDFISHFIDEKFTIEFNSFYKKRKWPEQETFQLKANKKNNQIWIKTTIKSGKYLNQESLFIICRDVTNEKILENVKTVLLNTN